MPKDDPTTVQGRKAAQVLKRAYRRMRRPSWARVAARYGLANKTRAYLIANGELQPNPQSDAALLRAVLREDDTRRRPKTMLRLIRRLAVPWLDRRQRNRAGVYGCGGRPL